MKSARPLSIAAMSALLVTPVGLLAQEQHLQSISESNFAAQDNAWASERVIDTFSLLAHA
jgi:hypothetical protein